MKARKLAWLIPLVGWVAFAGQDGAPTNAVGDAPAVLPHDTQVVIAPSPIRVLAEDAEAILAQMLALQQGVLPRTGQNADGTAADESNPTAEGSGFRRVIDLPTPTLVNRSPFFQFENLTATNPPEQKLSDETRRAMVERYRQSLSRRREAERK